jgi:hypothetical protein
VLQSSKNKKDYIMFSDSITFTDLHGSSDYTLNRINQDKYSSEYLFQYDTLEFRLKIRNTTFFDKKRGVQMNQHNAELTETVYAVAPSLLDTVRKSFFTCQVQKGDALAASREVAIGLANWLLASSAASLVKMTNFES